MKHFLEKPPYTAPAFLLLSRQQLVHLGRLIAQKHSYQEQARDIDARIKALLTPPKRQ